MNYTKLAIQAAVEAGKEILKVYESDFAVEHKEDRSPLTLADKNAHAVIVKMLSATSIPILSEEGKMTPWEERKSWNELWIVDPLDGTKEFVKRNGEFTVNIALVKDGVSVFGVIYQPVTDELFWGGEEGSYKLKGAEGTAAEKFEHHSIKLPAQALPVIFTIVASRSHLSSETWHFIEGEKKNYGEVNYISSGSSLKLCMIAENKAHVYPRFAPTMEWDTAAGHAIVKGVGRNIYHHQSLKELPYNKPNLVNDWFIAR